MGIRPTFIFNAISAKKNAGGAYQVALNFIKESLSDNQINWIYLISTDIEEGLLNNKIDLNSERFYTFPNQPQFLGSYWESRNKIVKIEERLRPELIYTSCAPSYFKFKAVEVFRFTNPWITNPNQYAIAKLNLLQRVRNFFYSMNQRRLIKKRKYFITQTETAKKGIIQITKVCKENVKVVPNVLPKSYESLETSNSHLSKNVIINNIISVSAAHPAKNLDIIPFICRILIDKYQILNFKFHLTLNEKSKVWERISFDCQRLGVRDYVENHGYQTQKQLSELYTNSNIFFLPTLIEVFSASLLEAAHFDIPIITTDLDFNKDVLKDGALYYNPMNAEDAAEKITQVIRNNSIAENLKKNANVILKNHPTYTDSYQEITNFLLNVANYQKCQSSKIKPS